MPITPEQLSQIIPGNQYVDQWCDALNKILPDYGIDTPQRQAAFLAQCAHESAGFTALQENLNYRAESLMRVWPRYFPTMEIATQYAHHPEPIANRAYANRMGTEMKRRVMAGATVAAVLFNSPARTIIRPLLTVSKLP